MTYGDKLAALADPTRRALFERMRGGPRMVGALAEGLPVSRAAVSQHLAALRAAGLVEYEAKGTSRIYRIRPQGLSELKRWLDSLWNEALEALRREAETPADRVADPPPTRSRRGPSKRDRPPS